MSMFAYSDPGDYGAEVVSPLVRAVTAQLPVNITSCCFSRDGKSVAAARGDGNVSLLSGFDDLPDPEADDGTAMDIQLSLATRAVHSVAATRVLAFGDGYVTAGQDGRVVFVPADPDAGVRQLWQSAGDWIEALAVHDATAVIAVAAGKTVIVIDSEGRIVAQTEMTETVSDIAFDTSGKRLAISRYGGVSVVSLSGGATEVNLVWRGWHLGVSWSPCGRYLVTSTQEKELHVWDLVTMQDFRIGGYQRKVEAMAWTGDGAGMVCSGADVITAWSFAGAGPNGRPPVEIGFVFGGTVRTVAASGTANLVAGGFDTGNVLIGATGKGEAVVAQARTGQPVTSLAWAPSGRRLAAGGMRGRFNLFTLAADLQVR